MTTKPDEPAPFSPEPDCEHSVHLLSDRGTETARGERARVQLFCRQCEKLWSGAEAALGVYMVSAKREFRRLERLIMKLQES